MNKDILKNAMFGYSKISVCQYIASMNEEFNAKLMAETNAFREERSSMQKKIDELKAELDVHKQNACDVGTMLLEAGQYAEQLRRQADEEAAELLRRAEENAAQIRLQAEDDAAQLRSQTKTETDQFLLEINKKGQEQTQKIELYTEAITKLREDIAILSERTDDALNQFMEQFLNLRKDFEDSEV